MAYSGTRADARKNGEHLYFTGVPCRRGHVAARFTQTAICTDCNREQSLAWGRANPDKKRENYLARRDDRREAKRLRDKEYREANRDRILAQKREYFARTKEARHAASKAWREANPEAVRAAVARFRKANPHKINAWAAMRRARKQQAKMLLSATHLAQIEAIYAEARRLTAETGVPHEADHIHPLVGGNFSGLHVPWNLQILTATENKRKGNKLVGAA